MIIIVNQQLRKYLEEKDELVKKGRSMSAEIEKVDVKLEKMKVEQRKFTEECEPLILIAKGNALQDKINKDIKELEKIGSEIQEMKLAAIPPAKKKIYEDTKAVKEEMERERNKIALKVQKIKDRAIPIIQKECKPHLGEYDDIETAEIKGEKIVVNTFNHLEQWKAKFNEQKKEKDTSVKEKV